MNSLKQGRSRVHKLLLPVADLGGMQFVPFADDGQRVFLFEDFKNDFEFEVGGKFAFCLAFHTGLKLARYPT